MARYEIELNDDTLIQADDVRFAGDGKFVELIPRKPTLIEGTPERLLINTSNVRSIHHRPIGMSGGWRFDGTKDSQFSVADDSV